MIYIGTRLKVADNSGAKGLQVVGIIRRSGSRVARVGDLVTAAVKGAESTGLVKDHTLVQAVIVRTRKESRRPDGSYIRFDDNAAVVLGEKAKLPKGTRVFGPVARELRERGFPKIVSMAKEVW